MIITESITQNAVKSANVAPNNPNVKNTSKYGLTSLRDLGEKKKMYIKRIFDLIW